MKKSILGGIILAVVMAGIQLIPVNYNQTEEISEKDIFTVYTISKEAETMLKKACYDCHSNNTNYPWYNKIQPISWFLSNHIIKGKQELNFSEFGLYSKRKQKSKLSGIENQINDGKMPLKSYKLLHKEARLNKLEKEEISKMVKNLSNQLN
ncbi:MAG: heme-binding domain-containing protein [Flavobacteriaceae bacterium]|nr:heme-binding domain-containing protein [Flavobacteriaceae bacterium]